MSCLGWSVWDISCLGFVSVKRASTQREDKDKEKYKEKDKGKDKVHRRPNKSFILKSRELKDTDAEITKTNTKTYTKTNTKTKKRTKTKCIEDPTYAIFS